MGGYIGSKAVSLSTTSADVTGDADIGGDLTVDTNTLYVDSTNNRVGVGTGTPARQLTVSNSGAALLLLESTGDDNGQLLFGDSANGTVGKVGYAHSTNHMFFNTNDTERMRIDSSGNVGIGTSSPASKIHIENASGGSEGYLKVTDAVYGGDVRFGMADGIDNDAVLGVWSNNNVRFYTNSSEAMRITSDGTLEVNGSIMSKDDSGSSSGVEGGELILRAGSDANQTKRLVLDNYDNTFRLVGQNDTDGSSGYVIFQVPSGFSLYSNSSGAAANLGVASSGELYRSTSSRRYKNTISDAVHGLAELLTLRPVTYKGNSTGDTLFGGLIAEEVHEAGLTEFVDYLEDENGDAILDEEGNPQADAIHYANMVSLCIKAIQEQQSIISDLETRLDALEAN